MRFAKRGITVLKLLIVSMLWLAMLFVLAVGGYTLMCGYSEQALTTGVALLIAGEFLVVLTVITIGLLAGRQR